MSGDRRTDSHRPTESSLGLFSAGFLEVAGHDAELLQRHSDVLTGPAFYFAESLARELLGAALGLS
jgi:hypothetical protein